MCFTFSLQVRVICTNTKKPLTAAVTGQSVGLQSLDRKCRPTKGQEEVAFHQCVGVSPEGAGREEERGGEEKGMGNVDGEGGAKEKEREGGGEEGWFRGGRGGLGGGSVFVLCVKCDHVLELLRQLGSSPAPGSQLVTVGGDTRAAELTLQLLSRGESEITTRKTLVELKSHLLILASMTTFTQTNHLCSRKQTKHFVVGFSQQ